MPRVDLLKGQLEETYCDGGGFDGEARFLTVRLDREAEDKIYNYFLRHTDVLCIFGDDGHIVWKGELVPDRGTSLEIWIPENLAKDRWEEFFKSSFRCEVKLAVPIIDSWKSPKDVPLTEEMRELSNRAMALYEDICLGKAGAYELKRATSSIDPVVLYFLCKVLQTTISLCDVNLRTQRIHLSKITSKFDAPDWAVAAERDAISQWFYGEYEVSQFEDNVEIGVRIILNKIES